jgi:hypothetical protein
MKLKEEILKEFFENFEVISEYQKYNYSYPCYITQFQKECITERLREAIESALEKSYTQGAKDAIEACRLEKMENTKDESTSDWFYGYGFNQAVETLDENIQKYLQNSK